MALLAGDILTAQKAGRLKPTPYWKAATGSLGASSGSNADVPGATITFNTETNLAVVQVVWFVDADLSGATTTSMSSRTLLDNITPSDTFAMFGAEVGTDRGTPGQSHMFTIPTAGSHTIKVQATTPANFVVNVYTTLSLLVHEVV